jgi:hypothetical protein
MPQMTQEEYKGTGGCKCPFCESEDIDAASMEVDSNIASQEICCANCDAEWKDLYDLKEYVVITKPDDGER